VWTCFPKEYLVHQLGIKHLKKDIQIHSIPFFCSIGASNIAFRLQRCCIAAAMLRSANSKSAAANILKQLYLTLELVLEF